MYQAILKLKKCVIRQCAENHTRWGIPLIILRHKKYVKKLLKKTHGSRP